MNHPEIAALRLLVVDDEEVQLNSLCALLRATGYTVRGCRRPMDALGLLQESEFDLMLADLVMPGMSGIELIDAANGLAPRMGCLVITAEATIPSSVEAVQAGALDFIPKPFDMSTLLPALRRAHHMQQLRVARWTAEAAERSCNDALEQVNRQLQRAHADAQRVSEEKSAFVARLSHELRTPLNAILGFSHILGSATLPSTPVQRREFAGHIEHAARHLLALVNDMLDLAQIEAGKLALQMETVAAAPLLADCAAMLAAAAAARDVQVQVQAAPDAAVIADRLRLKQIILNLLANAIKYNHPGGTVELAARLEPGAMVALTVSDTGPGLAPEQLARLFQPFERLEEAAGAQEGSGLGLVIVQQLAAQMQGDIVAASEPGRGTMFTVRVPAALP